MAERFYSPRADLSVTLGPKGLEPYADWKARVDELVAQGERAERDQAEDF